MTVDSLAAELEAHLCAPIVAHGGSCVPVAPLLLSPRAAPARCSNCGAPHQTAGACGYCTPRSQRDRYPDDEADHRGQLQGMISMVEADRRLRQALPPNVESITRGGVTTRFARPAPGTQRGHR